MRLTIQLAGFELDVTLGREQTDDSDDDDEFESRGSVTSSPVGFAPTPDAPFEYDVPHRFGAAEGDEDI